VIAKHQITLLGAFLMASLCGCRRTPSEGELIQKAPSGGAAQISGAQPTPPTAKGYDVPLRTDVELRSLFQKTCETAKAANKPILLNAGAGWCSDCRLLARLEQEEPLQGELSHFAQISVNLGEDAHEWLRSAFKIRGIARWIVFRPSDCQSPVESWKPQHSRVVEPASRGAETNAAELVTWLQSTQEKL
jgi:thiol-disulfide isomerase/thioredoxin